MIRFTLALVSCLNLGLEVLSADDLPRTAVVELFTSEGCSSCPPADILLGELSKRKWESGKVIGLAFHVDYWDRLGWKDRFSDKIYSQRQRSYALSFSENSVYTPQLFVDGKTGFVGSDRRRAMREIGSALAHADDVGVSISVDTLTATTAKLSYSIDGTVDGMDINVVLAQREAITEVKQGENAGRLLRHTHVVRAFRRLAAETTGRTELEVPQDVSAKDLDAIIYLQDRTNMAILGATRIPL